MTSSQPRYVDIKVSRKRLKVGKQERIWLWCNHETWWVYDIVYPKASKGSKQERIWHGINREVKENITGFLLRWAQSYFRSGSSCPRRKGCYWHWRTWILRTSCMRSAAIVFYPNIQKDSNFGVMMTWGAARRMSAMCEGRDFRGSVWQMKWRRVDVSKPGNRLLRQVLCDRWWIRSKWGDNG